jgi:hypothetical protein
VGAKFPADLGTAVKIAVLALACGMAFFLGSELACPVNVVYYSYSGIESMGAGLCPIIGLASLYPTTVRAILLFALTWILLATKRFPSVSSALENISWRDGFALVLLSGLLVGLVNTLDWAALLLGIKR